jgi:hypothetical protein
MLVRLRVLNGFDTDLEAGQTWVMNRLRDALTTTSPELEGALWSRLHQAGVRDLVAAFPGPTTLRAAWPSQVPETTPLRSPRLASKAAEAVAAQRHPHLPRPPPCDVILAMFRDR